MAGFYASSSEDAAKDPMASVARSSSPMSSTRARNRKGDLSTGLTIVSSGPSSSHSSREMQAGFRQHVGEDDEISNGDKISLASQAMKVEVNPGGDRVVAGIEDGTGRDSSGLNLTN